LFINFTARSPDESIGTIVNLCCGLKVAIELYTTTL
jgi:hypothetical protein